MLQVLDTVLDTEGRAAALEPGQLVKQYGQQFLSTAPALALEYYMQAAQLLGDALGDVRDVRGKLLRELLTQSNAFGFLLGSGGPNGGGAPHPVLAIVHKHYISGTLAMCWTCEARMGEV